MPITAPNPTPPSRSSGDKAVVGAGEAGAQAKTHAAPWVLVGMLGQRIGLWDRGLAGALDRLHAELDENHYFFLELNQHPWAPHTDHLMISRDSIEFY